MDFHFLDDYWHEDIFNEDKFYNLMRFYRSKYDDYVHASSNYDRLHVIHDIVNYFFNRNEETTQYKYAIIEFYINNVGHIGTNAFFPYYGNYLEPDNFMSEKYAEEYSILKIRYILN